MVVVFEGLWKTTSAVAQAAPLQIVNSVQDMVKSAPRKILTNIFKSRFVNYALETSPAEIITNVLDPLKLTKTEKVINELCDKVPLLHNVRKKLNVPAIEWYNYLFSSFEPHPNKDIGLTPVEMIRRNDYPVEVYKDIVTEDGYLLDLYRIPHGRSNKEERFKPVVFLVHGFVTSCADYLVAGPDKALGYMLADMGYDVWLGNPRGSLHSRKHMEYNPDCDKKFWDFSFHEIGMYDLPAMIDFILATTRQETLTYIGMSQGTAVFFTLASERPEYNQKINLMVALAPVAHLSSALTWVNRLGPIIRHAINHARDFIGPMEFPHKSFQDVMSVFYNNIQSKGFFQDIIIQVLFVLFGSNYQQLDADVFPVLLSTLPHSSSMKQWLHFTQIAISGRFQKFDHGSKTNMEMYGARDPPEYDLSRVEAPVVLFYSNGDHLSNTSDVMKLQKSLANCVHAYEVEDQNFNHIDYFTAVDIVPLLNRHVIRVVDEYCSCGLT